MSPTPPSETSTSLVFYVNGKRVQEREPDPEWTLLWYLRSKLGLVGSKLGCGEGGCGACTVMVSKMRDGNVSHLAVNACLAPVCMLHGSAVTTVEALGSTRSHLHPVQERLARAHGSQCGFCTPGFVMSAYALLRSLPGPPSMDQLEEALVGNLCRCTGYRPILEGLRTFTEEGQKGCGRPDCCKNKDSATEGDLELTDVLFDPAQFTPYDPTQEPIFPPELKLNPLMPRQALSFTGARSTFYQVNDLKQLLALKNEYPKAKIIVGNTEIGVEVRLKGQFYPVLVSVSGVEEMEKMDLEEEGLVVGAAVTLSRLGEAFREMAEDLPEHKTRVFSAIQEMLRWFAGKQIRNVACLGGNIMTSSPISDLNPILLAARAALHLSSAADGARSVPLDGSFFTGYRQCAVRPEEALLAVTIPFTGPDEFFKAYKQSRRRDDDIAIVNAAFRVRFKRGTAVVEDCSLAFGGVAAITLLAEKTMKLLIGERWGEEALLQRVTSSLVEEVAVAPSAPGGMAVYRSALVPSLFFKFYLEVRNRLSQQLPGVVAPLAADELELLEPYSRTHHKATHLFQKVSPGQEPLDPVGRALPHVAAQQQVTGEALYVDDLPHYANELFAAVVLSSKARARIVSVETGEALAQKGVHSFISAENLPGDRNITGVACRDEEVFARDEVVCVGQVIGLILAETREQARRAAKLVRVTYQEAEKPIITLQEAIEAKNWYPPSTIWTGDVTAGHQEAEFTLEGELHIGGQEHFYLEPNAHLAIPGECGSMEIISSTQDPAGTQMHVAAALGLPASKVVCRIKRLGGGFGGKESRTMVLSIPAAVAASVSGRPVRLVLERQEDMLITGTRHPFLGRWKASFSKEGLVSSVEMDLYSNAGCTKDLSDGVMERAMFSCDNAYRTPNFRVTGHVCRTNLPSNTAFRGYGGPQGMLIMEDIMAKVAAFLGKDPAEVRELNLYREGDATHFRQPLEGCTIRRCWEQALGQADYRGRREQTRLFNSTHQHRKRGIAAIPTKFAIGYTFTRLNQAGALVHIYRDGSVLLSHGGTEMGQGLHTKMIQVAARTLGVAADRVHVAETATDKVANSSPTAASASSDLNGEATLRACLTLKERLAPYRTSQPLAGWDDWVAAAYRDRVQLSATGFYATPGLVTFDFEKQEGMPYKYFSFGAAVSEVEIDCLTGDHTVLRADMVMDVGSSLNPAVDIGQVEGGFVQGQGLFTLEQLRYSPQGDLLTNGPGAYKLPGVHDIPCEFNVTLLKNAANPKAVLSSKAVGEPPVFLSASVFFAIRDAIEAARDSPRTSLRRAEPEKQSERKGGRGTEIPGEAELNSAVNEEKRDSLFRLDSPATAERIRLACEDAILRQVPVLTPGSYKSWDVTV